jgi:hypothetical protein
MNRRSFLQFLGITAVLPKTLVPETKKPEVIDVPPPRWDENNSGSLRGGAYASAAIYAMPYNIDLELSENISRAAKRARLMRWKATRKT